MPRRGENITKRKDGRWEARYIRGYSEDVKALYKFLYAKTYAEVKAKKAEELSASKAEKVLIKTNLTYDAVLTAFLLNRKYAVKESTYAYYCDIVDTHIRPVLGCLLAKIDQNAIFITAYWDSKICGYIAFYANDTDTCIAYITLIAVRPAYQSRGVGKALYNRCADILLGKGMTALKLRVNKHNEKALSFYRKSGFAVCGEADTDNYYMQKSL